MDEFRDIAELAYIPFYEELEEPLGICDNCKTEVYRDNLYSKRRSFGIDYYFDSHECEMSRFNRGDYNEYV